MYLMPGTATPAWTFLTRLAQLGDVVVDGAQHAETLDDLVGHELGVGVADAPVVGVVVALAGLDVVGQCARDVAALAVALDDVRDVVADHAAEPAALLPSVGDVVADVGRRRDADGDRVGVAAGLAGGLAHLPDGPARDVGVGELEDEAVGFAPAECERLGPVGGHPDL